ncbi:MAG: zinc-dependent peptidase [Bdellovibrionales bacterium]|nr:zinc-dependent peptidase [Bdellovibrionales bacterium]
MKWFHLIRRWRRWRATRLPFPNEWNEILNKNFPLDRTLSQEDRHRLRYLIQIFLYEKNIRGLNGLAITDEIRVTVAAQACLLLLHLDEDDFPNLYSVLIYPTAYEASHTEYLEGGLIRESRDLRLGETSKRGAVLLSWQDAKYGAADIHDGQNVVLHEFAHQLDLENNVADGAPLLPRRSMYLAWARVFSKAYSELQKDIEHHHKHVMSAYGATNAAEFFAVATETFFEKPLALKNQHFELYEQLRLFYRQDPAKRARNIDRKS